MTEQEIIAVLSDFVDYLDQEPVTPSWSEELVNILIGYAEARGIDRDYFVSMVLTESIEQQS